MPGPWEKYAAASAPASGPWAKYAQATPPEAPAQTQDEPGFLARAGQAAMQTLPGRSTYQAVKKLGNGADAYDVAGAAGGDIAQAALLAEAKAAAGARGLAKMAGGAAALNLAGDYMGGMNQKAGQAGGQLEDALYRGAGYPFQDRNTPSVFKNFMAQIPQAMGETIGELGPTAALLALGGKATGGLRGRAAATEAGSADAAAARQAAQDLGQHGYPVTESHAVPGDVQLKQALGNPALSAQREGYLKRLGEAQQGDVNTTLQPPRLESGPEATAALGGQFQQSATDALKARSDSYQKMMEMADSYAADPKGIVTGIGERTHAGKAFNDKMLADLAAQGVDVPRVRQKALLGEPLNAYDLHGAPANLSGTDVAAAIKFGDEASQLYPRPTDLAQGASRFADEAGIFKDNPKASNRFQAKTRGMAMDVAKDIIAQSDEAGAGLHPPLLPEFNKQRANWAQGADIADQRSKFQPRTDAQGQPLRAEMTSPEQVMRKDILSNGAQGVRQWKSFLTANGQDPAVIEKMALDHLDTLAGGSTGKITADSLKSAWQKLAGGANAEMGAELFSPQTAAKVQQLIVRMELAEKPLGVMGTQVRGGSQTSPLNQLAKFGQERMGGGVGAGVGAVLGGPAGSAVGALAGHALQKGGEALQAGRQAAFMERAPAAIGPEVGAMRRAAAQKRIAALIQSLGSRTLPAQAALSASR